MIIQQKDSLGRIGLIASGYVIPLGDKRTNEAIEISVNKKGSPTVKFAICTGKVNNDYQTVPCVFFENEINKHIYTAIKSLKPYDLVFITGIVTKGTYVSTQNVENTYMRVIVEFLMREKEIGRLTTDISSEEDITIDGNAEKIPPNFQNLPF